MIELIPVVGPTLSIVLGWPVKQLLTLPADSVIGVIKSTCSWVIGGGCG